MYIITDTGCREINVEIINFPSIAVMLNEISYWMQIMCTAHMRSAPQFSEAVKGKNKFIGRSQVIMVWWRYNAHKTLI